MRLIRQSCRLLVLLALLLQPMGLWLAGLTHLPLEARSLTHSDHVNAPGENTCVPHSDVVCPICRHLKTGLQATGATVRFAFEEQRALGQHLGPPHHLVSRLTAYPLGSRAPPQV
jgi:hypothetical protein